jgi:molecular chaperone DnaK
LDLQKILKDPEWLTVAFKKAKERLKELDEKRQAMGGSKAEQFLQETQIDQITHDVETSLAAAEVDRDACQKCQQELLNLKSALDNIEDELEWPALVSEVEEAIEYARDIIKKHGSRADQNRFSSLESEIKKAIYAHNADLLHLKLGEIRNLIRPIMMEQPGFWVGWLDYLADKIHLMTNRVLAERLISQGRRAIDANDFDELKAAILQLIDLLPPDEQESARSYGSTIMKFK